MAEKGEKAEKLEADYKKILSAVKEKIKDKEVCEYIMDKIPNKYGLRKSQ